MFKKILIGAALLFACSPFTFAQGVRVTSQVTSSLTTPGQISTVSNALINICTYPANAVPCTNKATTYSTITLGTPCSTSTQVVLDGTNNCVALTDGRGNWGIWIATGTYDYTVTVSTGQSFGPFTFTAGGSGGGGGSGTVGPCATTNAVAQFPTPTTVLCSTVVDDGTNPTRAPNGVNTASGPLSDEWLVDTGGVLANHLACRSASSAAKVVICPAGATLTIIGVAQKTVGVGGTVVIEYGAKANVVSTNNTVVNDWLVPSATVPGDVDDTGSPVPPTTKTFTWPAETVVTGGSSPGVQITQASLDTLIAASTGGNLPSCLQFSGLFESAAGTAATYGCLNPPNINGSYLWNWNVTANAAVAPTASLTGISNRNVAGGSDTILYSDRTNKVTYTNASPTAVTVPQAGSTGFTINTAFRTKVTGAGLVTFTPTTSTVNGAATFVQARGMVCTWYSDNANYTTDCWDAKRTCTMVLGTDNGPVLLNADIGPQGGICEAAEGGTIIEVGVKANTGTSTALPRKEHGGANTSLLSGALSTAAAGAFACSNVGGTLGMDGTTTCTNTLTTTALAKGDWLGVASGVADGVASRITVTVIWIETGT